jgi:hypothetical protein
LHDLILQKDPAAGGHRGLAANTDPELRFDSRGSVHGPVTRLIHAAERTINRRPQGQIVCRIILPTELVAAPASGPKSSGPPSLLRAPWRLGQFWIMAWTADAT